MTVPNTSPIQPMKPHSEMTPEELRAHRAWSHEWQYGQPADDECLKTYEDQTTVCRHHRGAVAP